MLSRFVKPEQADIYGRLIPSESSFLLLINELPDEESENEFIRRNNLWVLHSTFEYYPENLSPLDLGIELKKIRELKMQLLRIERQQINLSGMNFSEYIQNRAVVDWFLSLWGNHTLNILQSIFRNKELNEIPTNRLRQYPEYVIAENNLNRLDNLISVPIWEGSEAQNLAKEREKVSKQLARAMEAKKTDIRNKGGNFIHSWHCDYCGEYKSIQKGQTCGSEKCEKKYSADRTKKSKEKKRLEDTEKWVKDTVGINPRECKGGCGSDKRNVNSDDLCRKCHKLLKKENVKNVTSF